MRCVRLRQYVCMLVCALVQTCVLCVHTYNNMCMCAHMWVHV